MPLPTVTEHIVFLYTRDLAASRHFYEEVLELPLALDQGGCRIYRVAGASYLGVCNRETAPEQPEGVIVTFVTDDVDGFCATLAQRGVTLERGPQETPEYGIYNAFFRDPNGYLLEVQRFLEPDWDATR